MGHLWLKRMGHFMAYMGDLGSLFPSYIMKQFSHSYTKGIRELSEQRAWLGCMCGGLVSTERWTGA